jgi:hypothetical protein
MAQAAATKDPWWLYAYTSMFASIREQRWDRVTAKVHRLPGETRGTSPRSWTRQRRPRARDGQESRSAGPEVHLSLRALTAIATSTPRRTASKQEALRIWTSTDGYHCSEG